MALSPLPRVPVPHEFSISQMKQFPWEEEPRRADPELGGCSLTAGHPNRSLFGLHLAPTGQMTSVEAGHRLAQRWHGALVGHKPPGTEQSGFSPLVTRTSVAGLMLAVEILHFK